MANNPEIASILESATACNESIRGFHSIMTKAAQNLEDTDFTTLLKLLSSMDDFSHISVLLKREPDGRDVLVKPPRSEQFMRTRAHVTIDTDHLDGYIPGQLCTAGYTKPATELREGEDYAVPINCYDHQEDAFVKRWFKLASWLEDDDTYDDAPIPQSSTNTGADECKYWLYDTNTPESYKLNLFILNGVAHHHEETQTITNLRSAYPAMLLPEGVKKQVKQFSLVITNDQKRSASVKSVSNFMYDTPVEVSNAFDTRLINDMRRSNQTSLEKYLTAAKVDYVESDIKSFGTTRRAILAAYKDKHINEAFAYLQTKLEYHHKPYAKQILIALYLSAKSQFNLLADGIIRGTADQRSGAPVLLL